MGYNEASNRVNSPNFFYDASGNQTQTPAQNSSGQNRYEYDAAGRLKVVRDGYGNQLATYTYGATNGRLIAEQGDGRTYYVAAGGAVLAEYTEATSSTTPQWSQSYIYLGGRLLATTENQSGTERVEYHHPDRLGTRLTTNQSDSSTQEQATLPFGTVLPSETSGASTSRRFTSYDRSQATGLDYAVNRHYDPLQGRFTQVDPIGMSSVTLANPQTLNLYAYCANDPVNRIDPDGLGIISFFKKLFKWVAIALAVVIAVFTVVTFGAIAGVLTAKLALTSGALFAAAAGSPVLSRILSGAASFGGGGFGRGGGGPGGTGVFNPGAASGVGGVSNFIQDGYIFEDGVLTRSDGGSVLNESVTVIGRMPVGEPGFFESFIPIWGSGRATVHRIQTRQWGWAL